MKIFIFTVINFCSIIALSVAFNDTEAVLMSLEKSSSLLEPSKELYEQIHHDLASIRKSFPEVVSGIRYQPNWTPGKLLCNDMSEESVKKLNDSQFGPIKAVDRTGDHVTISFTKSFNSPVLIKKLAESGLLSQDVVCRVDGIVGDKFNIIYNYDRSYTFHKGLGDDRHYWTFTVKNGTAVLTDRDSTK